MKFIKIDENTVRCVVSQEEMEAYDVELEDFVRKNKKVKDFVELLIDKAGDEVGYEHSQGMMQLQLQPLPRKGLAITFSSREITPEELSTEIAARMGDEMADAFLDSIDGLSEEERRDKIAEAIESIEEVSKNNNPADEMKKITSDIEQMKHVAEDLKKAGKETGGKQPLGENIPNLYICKFKSLKDIGWFSRQIPERYYVDSSVYKDEKNNIFYLVIEKGRCKKVKYLFTCRLALEFGSLDSCSALRLAYLKEQTTCLVQNKAIAAFKKLYQN